MIQGYRLTIKKNWPFVWAASPLACIGNTQFRPLLAKPSRKIIHVPISHATLQCSTAPYASTHSRPNPSFLSMVASRHSLGALSPSLKSWGRRLLLSEEPGMAKKKLQKVELVLAIYRIYLIDWSLFLVLLPKTNSKLYHILMIWKVDLISISVHFTVFCEFLSKKIILSGLRETDFNSFSNT